MRNSISNHVEAIHTPASELWVPRVKDVFWPILNPQQLANLLEYVKANSPSQPTLKGKKRQASPSPPAHHQRAKRKKTSAGSVSRDEEDPDHLNDRGNRPAEYPYLLCDVVYPEPGAEAVPVFQHVAEIQYSTAACAKDDKLLDRWEVEERRLMELVDAFSESSMDHTVDLGDLVFAIYQDRLVGISVALRKRNLENGWLLLLPSLTHSTDLEEQGLLSPTSQDLLMACFVLQAARKATIKARLTMVVLSHEYCDPDRLPFRLHVEFNVSLLVPAIFQSPPPKTTKQRAIEIEDARRRLLQILYGSNPSLSDSFNESTSTNISYLYSVLRPAPILPSQLAEDAMQPDALRPTLLPFQRRSVAWLLDREGKVVTPEGQIVPKEIHNEFSFWDEITEGNHTWYYNRLSGTLSPSVPEEGVAMGGILAEEPGLGKTLETIALIMLNPSPPERNPNVKRWDPEARLDVRAIKTTLIVTPPALASQWFDELALHAPTLKVLVYDGWSKVKVPIQLDSEMEWDRLNKLMKEDKAKVKDKKKRVDPKVRTWQKLVHDEDMDGVRGQELLGEDGQPLDWCTYVHGYDVVITTYQVLRLDFNVARAAPVRPRREDVVYQNVERPRSPLVLVEWNRVIMDEVQMVGGGKTEDMVSLIPRLASFAVSGTPARAQISDLMHVLKFLRVDGRIGPLRMWNRLLLPGYAAEFAAFFQKYAIRTMKASVKEELTIPQQTRYLVSIELGKVERHVYDRTLEEILNALGLDARGIAASTGWQVDGVLLRSSLRRLRGICTHPQVGQLQKVGDKLNKPGVLKTMEAVLQDMRDQNWRNVVDDWKTKIQGYIRFAQLKQYDETDLNRYQHALDTLLLAEKEAKGLLEEFRLVLAEHDVKGEIMKQEARDLREARNEIYSSDVEQVPSSPYKGKGKERQMSPESDIDEEDALDERDIPRTPAGREHKVKRRAIQQRIRDGRLLLHRVKFLQGDVYHVLGASHGPSEDAAYAAAEELRRELLKTTEHDAISAMAQLAVDATEKRFTKEALLIDVPFLGKGGIQSSDLFDEANEIIENVLNDQAFFLWEWRTRITGLLTQKLNPGEDEADGQEYQRTLDSQGEAETYLQSYAALLADRREALINERTILAHHDVREKKLRHTKAAMKAANAAFEVALQIPDDIDVQPEHEVIHSELSTQRKSILSRLEGRAIKSIVVDLNNVVAKYARDSDHPEKVLAQTAIDDLRRLIAEQTALQDKLDVDLAFLRKAFNQRILYFRQLQEISDSVAEVEREGTVENALEECTAQLTELDATINTYRARHRFLEFITKAKDDGTNEEEDRTCILCRCDFVRGFITQCAHIYCEGCMKAWLLRKEGKTCPVCRVAINADTIQRFTVDAINVDPPAQPINGEPAPKSLRQISYNKIDPKIFAEIQTIESFGDFGTKIQTLVRHLLYLRLTDNGAKSIVFSAWADSLHIVEWALRENGIQCLRIDQNSRGESAAKRFRTDPNILVLLLHGERENAGLNVTCASRVFLLESVVHHSFEVQAIARIDRMGQTRPTEVYCYYAEDTVEKNILDLAARQGLSLYTKENAAGTVNVSSFVVNDKTTVDAPIKKAQKGDFIFKIDDMLAILFPHMYEDIAYLVPQDSNKDSNVESFITELSNTRSHDRNAVAGPSRLS